jgi:hypothetical protein
MSAGDFIAGFLEGTSNIRRYGHYYTIDNSHGFRFLLHHNPNKRNATQYGMRTRTPFLLAIRDPENRNILVAENTILLHGGTIVWKDRNRDGTMKKTEIKPHYPEAKLNSQCPYWISIEQMDKEKYDLFELKLIDSKRIPGSPVNVALYDINGARLLTDLQNTVPDMSLGRWLNFEDYRYVKSENSYNNMTLQRVRGLPETVPDARKQLIPQRVRDKLHLKIHGHAVLERVLRREAEYPEERYKRLELPVPSTMLPTRMLISYSHFSHNDTFPSESPLYSPRIREQVERYKSLYDIHKAEAQALQRDSEKANEVLSEANLAAGDFRFKDGIVYVSEFVISPHHTQDEYSVIKLGDAWHRVHPFRRK